MHKLYEKQSADELWRPHRKVIRKTGVETRPTHRKQVRPPQEQLSPEQKEKDIFKPHRRHISSEEVERRIGASRTQEVKPTDLLPRRGRPRDDNGNLIREIYRGEQTLDVQLQRKKKIDPADISCIRNGIGFSKPGDNLVCTIEYHPGFYKTPGNIPGSTWGNFKPLPDFFQTEWARKSRMEAKEGKKVKGFGDPPSPPRVPGSYREMSVAEKRRAEALASEVDEIRNLNPTSSKAKDDTWENRTGNLTIFKEKPKPTEESESRPGSSGSQKKGKSTEKRKGKGEKKK